MPTGRTDPDGRPGQMEWKRRVDEHFLRLLGMAPSDRASRLQELDRSDPRTSRELRSLLISSHQAASEFEARLDNLAGSMLRSVRTPIQPEGPPLSGDGAGPGVSPPSHPDPDDRDAPSGDSPNP